jgi:peptidoglycan hydrolase CwlO-like protein
MIVQYGPSSAPAPPVISGVTFSPKIPSPENLISVNASVTDETALSSVSLSYTVNSSSTTVLPMSTIASNEYNAVIPRQSSGSNLSITVSADNVEGLSATSPPLNITIQRPSYYTSLLANYDTLQSELKNESSALSSLEKELDSGNAGAGVNSSTYKALESQIQNLNQEVNALQNENTTLTSNYSALTSTYNTLEKNYAALSNEYSDSSAALDKSQAELKPITYYAIAITIVAAVVWALFAFYLIANRRKEASTTVSSTLSLETTDEQPSS